jgi:hypothetical protein
MMDHGFLMNSTLGTDSTDAPEKAISIIVRLQSRSVDRHDPVRNAAPRAPHQSVSRTLRYRDVTPPKVLEARGLKKLEGGLKWRLQGIVLLPVL